MRTNDRDEGMSSFFQIQTKDNWTYLTYFLPDGTQLDEKKGGLADVQWPDGSIDADVPFESRISKTSYLDSGRLSHSQTYRFWVTISQKGLERKVNLLDLQVRNVRQP